MSVSSKKTSSKKMAASNGCVQGSLYNRGKELYLTQVYYSVFDQSVQGLPLDARVSVFADCFFFFLSIEDPLLGL